MTSSIDGSLVPSSSKVSKLNHQRSQTGEIEDLAGSSDIIMHGDIHNMILDEGKQTPVLSETEDAILYLRTLFPIGAFDSSPSHQLPPVVLKHQLYSLLPDRTSVDRELVWIVR